jgi:hypothetical protein
VGRFAALAAVVTAVLLFAPAALSQPRTFADEIGDAGTAADIASLWVSNDLDGNYLVNTTFATPITPVSNYIVYVDLDRNPKTGSPGGAEFSIGHCRGAFLVSRWDGSQWVPSKTRAYESIAPDRKFLGFRFAKAGVGGDEDFDVYAISRRMDASDDEDDAPEGTTNLHYTPSSRVTIEKTVTLQGAARSGGYWTVALQARRSDTGQPLESGGLITCTGAGGGARLPIALSTFGPGLRKIGMAEYAMCIFRIGKGLRGRPLRATVKVSYRGTTLTQSFTSTAK